MLVLLRDPAINVLQHCASEVRIVFGVSVNSGGCAGSKQMWADFNAERQESGRGYCQLDAGIAHALA